MMICLQLIRPTAPIWIDKFFLVLNHLVVALHFHVVLMPFLLLNMVDFSVLRLIFFWIIGYDFISVQIVVLFNYGKLSEGIKVNSQFKWYFLQIEEINVNLEYISKERLIRRVLYQHRCVIGPFGVSHEFLWFSPFIWSLTQNTSTYTLKHSIELNAHALKMLVKWALCVIKVANGRFRHIPNHTILLIWIQHKAHKNKTTS